MAATFAVASGLSTGSVISRVSNAFHAVLRFVVRRRTVAILQQLTDAELNDIGLTRGQVLSGTYVRG